jgi:16S rRNA (adenine1518-N6/adenine1519-N6)-dimethyltransferase
MMQGKRRLGQHFLEPAWADKLVAAIAPKPSDRVIEIGPGPGALTLRLAPLVRHVTAVELDAAMVAALKLKLPANVELVRQDFLEFDLSALGNAGSFRVVGNLPYNVSSPILFRLIREVRERGRLTDATIMLQHEVAERLEAPEGSRDYGVLAILVQLHADVRRLLTLPPGAFRPVPAVRSAVVRLTFRPPVVTLGNHETFEAMTRSIFTRRRKTLANALRPFAEARGRRAADVLAAAGIDGRRRPETLRLGELARISDVLASPQPRAVL